MAKKTLKIDSFDDMAKRFPIKSQADLDSAVAYLRGIRPGDQLYNRAQAWLSYAYWTALLDRWSWSSFSQVGKETAEGLAAHAVDLVQTATQMEMASERAPYDYDVLWARAFSTLNDHKEGNDPGNSLVDYRMAITLGKEGAGYRDPNLLVEAADGMVYRGQLSLARSWLTEVLQKDSPDWWHWVDAWVHLGAYLDKKDNRTLSAAMNAFEQMDRDDSGAFREFDAAVVLAACLVLDGRPDEARREIALLQRRVKAEKGLGWTLELERQRSPFAATATGRKLRDGFEAALAVAFGEPSAPPGGKPTKEPGRPRGRR